MSQVVRARQPQIHISVAAETARRKLVQVITADDSHASVTTVSVDTAAKGVPSNFGATTFGPKATVVPDSPWGAAGYFQTSPIIDASQELTTKITNALRKAESWGWSHAPS